MSELITYSLAVFMGFFAIMNPIANTPIFLSLVEGFDRKDKRKTAKTATLSAFLIVISFIFLGKYLFVMFGITIPAFKITGGILIFYVGFQMLMSQKSKIQHSMKEDSSSDVAISPLAIPLLAGPGTLVTAMNYVTNATFVHVAIVIGVFGLIALLNYLAFLLSDRIVYKLGRNIIAVIGKLMGLILAIIGTSMITEGIKLSFNL